MNGDSHQGRITHDRILLLVASSCFLLVKALFAVSLLGRWVFGSDWCAFCLLLWCELIQVYKLTAVTLLAERKDLSVV